MRFRRLALLIGLYLALDFANPMMPGAVQLVDGSLQTVAGHQIRSVEDPVPAASVLPRYLAIISPQPRLTLPAPRIVSVAPPMPVLFRAPLESSSTSASSLDDD
jgi:hypothetical protein